MPNLSEQELEEVRQISKMKSIHEIKQTMAENLGLNIQALIARDKIEEVKSKLEMTYKYLHAWKRKKP